VRILPFLEQDDYDRLLWACDCNFVRGEDSFLRGQWALRPLVWQPYPQSEGTHLRKLEAFLRIYCRDLPEEVATAVADLWQGWSHGVEPGESWPAYWTQRKILARHADKWAAALQENGEMAAKLAGFCSNKL